MLRKIMAFAKDEQGATAIEYGLIAAGIAVAIIAAGSPLGETAEAAGRGGGRRRAHEIWFRIGFRAIG